MDKNILRRTMILPKMILFDYGHTLLYEPDFDALRGERALFQYVVRNKNNLSPEEVNTFSGKLFDEIGRARAVGIEIHERQFQRMLYEYLEIELSISYEEAEMIFWNHTSTGAVMPNAGKMIDFINSKRIRSGVISNIGFSENALRNRFDRLLPNHRFEFIIASSEYSLRKPSHFLFNLALRKAGLSPDEVWFCGDNVKADVEGSAAVGIFPVWYEDLVCENPWREQNVGITPGCDYIHINDWFELIEILEGIK